MPRQKETLFHLWNRKAAKVNLDALDGGYDVLVTGQNTEDEATALYGKKFNWERRRQEPELEASSRLVRKAKPLCQFYDR